LAIEFKNSYIEIKSYSKKIKARITVYLRKITTSKNQRSPLPTYARKRPSQKPIVKVYLE